MSATAAARTATQNLLTRAHRLLAERADVRANARDARGHYAAAEAYFGAGMYAQAAQAAQDCYLSMVAPDSWAAMSFRADYHYASYLSMVDAQQAAPVACPLCHVPADGYHTPTCAIGVGLLAGLPADFPGGAMVRAQDLPCREGTCTVWGTHTRAACD
jgi:hypothetical protein